jgi:FkbM family methyltransferase
MEGDIRKNMTTLASFLLKLRPAPLASFAARICGLSKRRFVRTEHGTFFINPISNFGSILLGVAKYEPQMVSVLRRYLRPGAVFIDLGANEGYFSVIASGIVGTHGTVIAVEPQSRLQNVIQTNLDANDCFNVRLVRCALSGRTEKVRLALAPDINIGSSSLFRQTKYVLPTEEVQSFCLDEFLDRVGVDHCDLMKVDIEGSEYDVFMAAGDVLRKGILNHVALEIHHSALAKRGLAPDTLHAHMVESGYRVDGDLGPWVYSISR